MLVMMNRSVYRYKPPETNRRFGGGASDTGGGSSVNLT